MPYLLRPGNRAWRSTKLLDLTGHKYGRWTVLKIASRRGRHIYWECVCECGVVKDISRCSLRNGFSKSCGCLNEEVVHGIEHGMTRSPEWVAWINMRTRCLNQNNNHWRNYGGRGIKICQRWLDSFVNFYADMGPSNGMTIERDDVNGNYEPNNCRWIPSEDQSRNKTTTRKITAFGREQLFIDWARELDMKPSHLHYHLKTGRTIEEIVKFLNPDEKICVCGSHFMPTLPWQEFCTRECKEVQRQKRRLRQRRDTKSCMFMVVRGAGESKRYARCNPTTGEWKWIKSKMWAAILPHNDAVIMVEKLGAAAFIEQRGVFIRDKEYAKAG